MKAIRYSKDAMERVQGKRKAAGLSQNQLADLLGISQRTYRLWVSRGITTMAEYQLNRAINQFLEEKKAANPR